MSAPAFSWFSSSSAAPPGLPPDAGADPDELRQAWQQVHRLLVQRSQQARTLVELASFAVYQCSVYQAFGQAQDATLAQHLVRQLAQGLLAGPAPTTWSVDYLEQACRLAWLHAGLGPVAPLPAGLLPAELDHHLATKAQHLLAQPSQHQRRDFFRIVRYFSLRQPGPQPARYLRQLLTQAPGLPALDVPAVVPLGLADGLASELLLLMRVYTAGLPLLEIEQYLRAGIRQLLVLKRDVDFDEHRYSIFPCQVQDAPPRATFGPSLSWQQGDLGPALLLYTGRRVLQEAELDKLADLVGLNTLLRTTVRTTGIVSAPLLQGAAGVAHLYGKLFRASGRPAYQQGQRFWISQTQHWLHQEPGFGLPQPPADELRYGLVGVGLVLLSALVETELEWDTLLL